jgi:alpha-mannosidase
MALSFFPNGGGKLPGPSVTLSDAVVQVTAVKQAEDGEGLIVRLFEPTGQPRETTVSLPFAGLSKAVSLKGFEVRTLKASLQRGTWDEVNLVEEGL